MRMKQVQVLPTDSKQTPIHLKSLGCIGTHSRAHNHKSFNPYTGGILNQ